MPFSCKARAVCPSCGGRRVAEQAAHLVEAVLPSVPVRQWVLTVPHRLRYGLAFDHALCRTVLGVFIRAALAWYRRRGRRAGVLDGQSGTVTVVQRFGSGLELNVHFHALGLDGVFAPGADGTLRFHRLPPPNDADVACLVATIARRVARLLARRGLVADADGTDPLAAESLALSGLASAAVQGRIALGPAPGRWSTVWAPILTPPGTSRRGRYRRAVTASTCMAALPSQARIEIGSSSSAGISCVCLRAEDVLTFLGRKLHGRFAGELLNDWKRRWPGARVKHWMKANWIKM